MGDLLEEKKGSEGKKRKGKGEERQEEKGREEWRKKGKGRGRRSEGKGREGSYLHKVSRLIYF